MRRGRPFGGLGPEVVVMLGEERSGELGPSGRGIDRSDDKLGWVRRSKSS